MKKYRVLRIINRFNLGGPTYNVAYLTKYMDSEYETVLLGGLPEEGEESSLYILHDLGIRPVLLKKMKRSLNILNDLKTFFEIRNEIKKFKPDIVHTHASKAGALGRIAAITCGVPIVVHTYHGHVFHSYFSAIFTFFIKNIERWLSKKSNAIIAISEIQKKELCSVHKIVNQNKVQVIPLGFDLDRFRINNPKKRDDFRSKYFVSEDEIAIGIVGRLAPIKNHELFLKIVHQLKKKSRFTIKAFIIGDGIRKSDLKDLGRKLGLIITDIPEKNQAVDVVFCSWVPRVDEALPGLDLLLMTSLNEGTPVSLIEAQAAGIPVVTTNVGGIQDILHPEAGIIVNSFDENEFSEIISQLIEDRSKLEKMRKSGADFVFSRFHYQRLINDMSHLYENLLKGSI